MRFVTSGKQFLQLVAKPELKRVLPGFGSENVRMAQCATFLRLLLCVPSATTSMRLTGVVHERR